MLTITFTESGSLVQCFNVAIRNDDIFELDESFVLAIESSTESSVLVANASVSVIIQDDEGDY